MDHTEDIIKKEYELALLLKAEEDVAHIVLFLREHNAEISLEPRAKKLALAYKIKGFTDAVFVYCNFKSSTEDAKVLEKDLNTNAYVIRSMILASPPAPSERQSMPFFAAKQRRAPARSSASGVSSTFSAEPKSPAPQPLSNEALEKKIEEILQ